MPDEGCRMQRSTATFLLSSFIPSYLASRAADVPPWLFFLAIRQSLAADAPWLSEKLSSPGWASSRRLASAARRCGMRSSRGAAACGRCRSWQSAGWIAPFGGDVPDFDPKELIQPRKSIKVMSRDIQLASAAAEIGLAGRGPVAGDARSGTLRRRRRGRHHVLRSRGAARFRSSNGSSRRISTFTAGRARRWASCTRCGCSSICRTCRPATSAFATMPAGRTTRSPRATCRRCSR